jgi:hypothetical protein
MTDAPVATQVHQTLDTHRDFTTEVTLDGVSSNLGSQLLQHIFGQIPDFLGLCNPGRRTDLLRTRTPNAIDVGKTYDSMFVVWNINSCNSSHFCSRFSAAKRAILAI